MRRCGRKKWNLHQRDSVHSGTRIRTSLAHLLPGSRSLQARWELVQQFSHLHYLWCIINLYCVGVFCPRAMWPLVGRMVCVIMNIVHPLQMLNQHRLRVFHHHLFQHTLRPHLHLHHHHHCLHHFHHCLHLHLHNQLCRAVDLIAVWLSVQTVETDTVLLLGKLWLYLIEWMP